MSTIPPNTARLQECTGLSDKQRKPSVAPEVYTEQWLLETAGLGSHERFLESGGKALPPRLARMLELADISECTNFLDVGCGRGEAVARASRLGARRAVGMDYARLPIIMADDTLRYLANHLPGEAGILHADANHLPFSDRSFDRILFADVIEHLNDREVTQVLQEISRVLRDDGYLIVRTLPNSWALEVGYGLARFVVPGLPPKSRLELKRDVFHVNEQSVISLSHALERGGFEYKVWLEDMMSSQAQRQEGYTPDNLPLGRIYARLRNPFWGVLFRFVIRSPLRMVFANDILAIAWLPDGPVPAAVFEAPPALTERVLSSLCDTKAMRRKLKKYLLRW